MILISEHEALGYCFNHPLDVSKFL